MISVFDLFKIGIGPSSSHTVGPMKAARLFAEALFADGAATGVAAVRVELFGSLGATGRGHGTDRAVILGLIGETPEHVDPDRIGALVGAVREAGRLSLLGRREIAWDEADAPPVPAAEPPAAPQRHALHGPRPAGAAARARASTTRSAAASSSTTERPSRPGGRLRLAAAPLPFPFHTGGRPAAAVLGRTASASAT